jgi:hypothetical protein
LLNEALEQAQAAIANDLRKAGKPVEARKLLEEIKDRQDIKDIDLREAVWYLIGQGEIVLTWDRKVVSREFADSYPHRGQMSVL